MKSYILRGYNQSFWQCTHQLKKSGLSGIFAFCVFFSGCSIQYADPYYGYHDETKTFATEGLIATMNQGGPFVRHPKRPDRWQDFPKYEAQACETDLNKTPATLKRLSNKLQQTLPGFQQTWVDDRTKLLIDVPQESLFYVDAPHLRPDAYKKLDSIISLVTPHHVRIDFIGHTDATGHDSYNLTLSAKRALHLQRYFVLKGLPKYLSTSRGVGESYPVASNEDKIGRKKNRRVTLLFCTIEET